MPQVYIANELYFKVIGQVKETTKASKFIHEAIQEKLKRDF